jgi:hypothetical protein
MTITSDDIADAFDNFVNWMKGLDEFEDEMELFEDEASDLQLKLQIIANEFADISSESPKQSRDNRYSSAGLIKFMTTSSNFSDNLTAYYDKKFEYEIFSTELFEKFVASENDFLPDNIETITDFQMEKVMEKLVSLQNQYIPKITDMQKYLEDKLVVLRKDYSTLKSEYHKFLQ